MNSATDLESGQGAQAQPAPVPRVGVGSGPALPGGSSGAADEASLKRDPGGSNIELNIVGGQPSSPSQAEEQIPVLGDPNVDSGPGNTETEEPRMIGDFDGSASEFWKLFIGEAKNDDDARINTLKEGMDSALIFAGLFSAALTAFVIDSKQNLKQSPADETVYYLRQHSTILSQISVQLSSIAPQVAIPSTPPPPFPSFTPSPSDIRINVFWFMALAFSLLAALMAILVQQWVRNYMHVFQRYGDPLKSSRVRQYLYEGCEKWYMRRVAEAVPGFLHVALVLFFIGLCDSLLNLNTKVALSTIVPIGISGLLYIFTTLAPIIYPQSPYQNILSGIIWYLTQKLHGRRFRDRGPDGEIKPVSTNMAQGQMQLAMEETVARKDRDVTAIRWLINNLTEDAEMEKFLSAIPGSFNTEWGTGVWERVGKHEESEDQDQDERVARPDMDTTTHHPAISWTIRSILRPIIHLLRKPTPHHPSTHATTRSHVHVQGENVVHELSTRVAHSVTICKNRGLFANDGLWQKHTRACIESTASLVFCANANLSWFEGISRLLGDIGAFEKIRELSLARTDELFVMRWTCLSLVALRLFLENSTYVQYSSTRTVQSLAEEDLPDNGDPPGQEAAHKIDDTLTKACSCLSRLYFALRNTGSEDLTEEVKEIVRGLESDISELEQINTEADHLDGVDNLIFNTQSNINLGAYRIFSQLPGTIDVFDPHSTTPIPFSRLAELSHDPRKLQFIRPAQILKSMCSPSLILRNILQGQGDADAYKEMFKNLMGCGFWSAWKGDEMRQRLWYMHDLGNGGGLGFTVQLFFLAFSQLFVPSFLSNQSHSALYTGTFRAITSDWRKHKDFIGTQNLLLNIAILHCDNFAEHYPGYIVDEFLSLLGNVLEGQTNPQIDRAREWFEQLEFYDPNGFRERVLGVLTRGQAQSLAS